MRLALLACLCAGILVPVAGCKTDFRGDGFNDPVGESVGQLRAPDRHNKEKWGFSNKSREIEENLGLR